MSRDLTEGSKAATWGGCRYRCRNHKYPGPGDTGGSTASTARRPKQSGSEIRSGRETEARSV